MKSLIRIVLLLIFCVLFYKLILQPFASTPSYLSPSITNRSVEISGGPGDFNPIATQKEYSYHCGESFLSIGQFLKKDFSEELNPKSYQFFDDKVTVLSTKKVKIKRFIFTSEGVLTKWSHSLKESINIFTYTLSWRPMPFTIARIGAPTSCISENMIEPELIKVAESIKIFGLF